MAFHGIQIKRESSGIRPVRTVLQSLIAAIGTAPSAAADGAFGDGSKVLYNHPHYLTSRQDASDADIGTDGTLFTALNGIFRQGQAPCQMVIVPEGIAQSAIASQTLAIKKFSTATSQATLNAPTLTDPHWAVLDIGGVKYLAFNNHITSGDETILKGLEIGRKIEVYASGGSDVLKTYTIEGAYSDTNSQKRIQINDDADHDTLTNSTSYDLKTDAVAQVSKDEATRKNMIGSEANGTGVYALMAADPIPKILCMGSPLANTRVNGNANALAAAIIEVAQKLRATAVLDGPNTDMGSAIEFAGDFDSQSAFLVDPGIITADGDVLASPSVAGLIAVNDHRRGFWTSPSNQVIQGVLGTKRTISNGFVGSHADVLNTNLVATIIRDGGFNLWGNETLSHTDPTFRFLSIARTANVIEDSLRASHKWAVDRNISARYFELVSQSVNSFLKGLQADGAILGGECYPDREKISKARIKEGQADFKVEWSGSYPAQTLNIGLDLNDRFIEALLAEI